MSLKMVYLVVSCYLLAATRTVASASTKEVYLESDLKVKGGKSQEDLDQFFNDQPHLSDGKQEGAELGQDGLSVGQQYGGLPSISSILNLYQLTTFLSQLGLPTISPSSIAEYFLNEPTELFNQFLSQLGLRDIEVSSSKNDTAQITNKNLI